MQQTNIDQIQLIRFFSRHNADYLCTKEGKTPKGYKRHFFILTHKPESVLPIRRIEKYDQWLDKINALRYVAIIHGLNNLEIYEKMRELVIEILITKNGIIQNYLGDFFESG